MHEKQDRILVYSFLSIHLFLAGTYTFWQSSYKSLSLKLNSFFKKRFLTLNRSLFIEGVQLPQRCGVVRRYFLPLSPQKFLVLKGNEKLSDERLSIPWIHPVVLTWDTWIENPVPKTPGHCIIKESVWRNIQTMTYPGWLRDRYTPVWAPKFWCPKKSFKFSFFSCISTKVAINDFTMHIISYFEMA